MSSRNGGSPWPRRAALVTSMTAVRSVDTNLAAEAAKLQALQVKQSLSGGTLNIANQRPQTLLSLFNT